MMFRRSFILFVVVVSTGSKTTDAGDEASSALMKQLQGSWQAVEVQINGSKAEEDDTKAIRMTFKGDELGLMTCKGDRCIERKKSFTIRTISSPTQIDLAALDGAEKGTIQPGIVSIDGTRLKLCVPLFDASKRPEKFETRAGDGFMFVVLERTKTNP